MSETKTKDFYMTLGGEAVTEEAKAFVASLALRLHEGRRTSGRAKPGALFTQAVGAVLCDLLQASEGDGERWAFRSRKADTFSGRSIGLRIFVGTVDELERQGLVAVQKGGRRSVRPNDGLKDWNVIKGVATKIRATDALLSEAASAGLTGASWSLHFRYVEEEDAHLQTPAVAGKKRNITFRGLKYEGFPVTADPDHRVIRPMWDQVVRINDYLRRQSIEVPAGSSPFLRLQRKFNDVVDAKGPWDRGGRLYAVGGSYQTAKKPLRSSILINGEPVVERDIRASHLTILNTLQGVYMDVSQDPYAVPDVDRSTVKIWVTATLGHDRLHRQWPDKAREKFAEKGVTKLPDIRSVEAAISAKWPIFSLWGTLKQDWGTLQYVESCAMVETVEKLGLEMDIPCLPVHDSIIIQVRHEEAAIEVLKDIFFKHVGIIPHIE